MAYNPKLVKSGIIALTKGRVLEAHLNAERVRFLRADLHSAPGRLRASFTPVLRPVREVLSLDWDRRRRVTPAKLFKLACDLFGKPVSTFPDHTLLRVPGSMAWS
jgi:hypothetical protein